MMRFWLTLATLFQLSQLSHAAVLSSSRLEACVNDGSEDIECDTKVVLAITLEHGQEETEHAEFLVRDVVDSSENTRQLQKPWRVSWRKTRAFWRYPLRYVQDVNNKPTEKIIKVGWLQCSDNPTASEESLTCGVAKQNGERAPDSEGFCCGCDLADITGGLPTRGELQCSTLNPTESAHCLGFDPLWYSVYEVDRPQIFYDIQVSIAVPQNPGASWDDVKYKEQVLTLSHQQPIARSQGGEIRVELVGDLATATAPHRFESRYLVVPNQPLGHPRVNPRSPLQHAMLIDRGLFELSGRTCDKIGVSYRAFKRQTEKCESTSGSCLHNQLDDYHKEDVQRAQQPRYFVTGFCHGAVELGKERSEDGGSRRFLACPLQQRHTTLLRLEARADQTMFVTNVASGKIVDAEVKTIEALQGRGELVVQIVSIGRVPAEFVLGVSNCTLGFEAGPAVRTSVEPYGTSKHRIALHASRTQGGHAQCTATLYDALGSVLEFKVVNFNVTDLQESKGVQVPVERAGEDATGKDPTGSDCAALCPSMIDAWCLLMHSCYKRLGMLIIMIAILVLLLYCGLMAVWHGIPCRMMNCFCRVCCRAGNAYSTKESKQHTIIVNTRRSTSHSKQPVSQDAFKCNVGPQQFQRSLVQPSWQQMYTAPPAHMSMGKDFKAQLPVQQILHSDAQNQAVSSGLFPPAYGQGIA